MRPALPFFDRDAERDESADFLPALACELLLELFAVVVDLPEGFADFAEAFVLPEGLLAAEECPLVLAGLVVLPVDTRCTAFETLAAREKSG